jgi:hypothetical protein
MTNRVRPCLECGRPAAGSRCREHTRHYGYGTRHWQTLRRQRLQLDGYSCTLQLPGCTLDATTVLLAPELEGDHRRATLDNTRSACLHCHGVVDAPRSSETGASQNRSSTFRMQQPGTSESESFAPRFS